MKAVQFAHFGERDVLEYIDVATPKPKNDDLLIEVTAAGVNFVDIRERMGVYGRHETHVGHIDLPHISGLQAVGTVMEVGPSGDRSRIGAKVMSYLPAGGGYAQFAVAPAKLSVQLPTSIDETAMAALPLAQGRARKNRRTRSRHTSRIYWPRNFRTELRMPRHLWSLHYLWLDTRSR
jgi:NADPH2:quinone reductase